ncbi:hypothetical protein LTR36_001067 [Oleoguttula mirabilis]|uniref:Plasmid pRiA4b Orf3-like domain-containing protein n=1 Tax=Oleoguttula mirabilis TaxID=1507867 RepID=A0AAV9JQX5_9PEZI|nr:hypothetical protein LTR36_001067 [Oleoguttula mirabilis]
MTPRFDLRVKFTPSTRAPILLNVAAVSTEAASCKRPNYLLKVDLCPLALADRVQNVISDPPVNRTFSCPATATFHQLHEALQVSFSWASTHTYDFTVLDPAFDPRPDASDKDGDDMELLMHRMNHGMFATDPREYVLRVKDDRDEPNRYMLRVDLMHDRKRQHPRTKEMGGLATKLFQVLDDPKYRDERIVYTYDFGDKWKHTVTVDGRAPATSTFSCVDGSGHGVAEDVAQDGWEPLKLAYRASRPSKEQKEKRDWYERRCGNRDRLGLGNGREHFWDRAAVNARLSGVKCG